MEKMDPSQQRALVDSPQAARDTAVPGFVISSLIAGLPFLGLMMTVAILSEQEQVERLVNLLVTLLVEGLCIAFFWRRVEPTSGKNFAVAAYAVGLWAFMGGCLVTTFGLRFGGMSDLARNVALLGSGVVAISGFFFAIVWAQSQAPRLMVQTHTMIATSVVLAGFAALVLKGSTQSPDHPGETLSARPHHAQANPAEDMHGNGGQQGVEPHHSGPANNHDKEPSNVHSQNHGQDHGVVHGGVASHGSSHSNDHDQRATSDSAHRDAKDPHPATHEAHDAADHHGAGGDSDKHGDQHGEATALQTHEWSYEGSTGPETWGKIKPEWKACHTGREQSPVEIAKGSKESRRMISLSYEENTGTVINNGELLQVILGRGSQAIINGKAYELTRLDFHSPSEHEISGVSYPMEIQFVHKDNKGRLAILSAFVEKGPIHTELGKILNSLPAKPGAQKNLKNPLQLASVLPREATALSYQYKGSLTTPPCSEGILWSVLKTPLRMGEGQIAAFRAQFAGSNRPIQSLGKRHIGPIEGHVSH